MGPRPAHTDPPLPAASGACRRCRATLKHDCGLLSSRSKRQGTDQPNQIHGDHWQAKQQLRLAHSHIDVARTSSHKTGTHQLLRPVPSCSSPRLTLLHFSASLNCTHCCGAARAKKDADAAAVPARGGAAAAGAGRGAGDVLGGGAGPAAARGVDVRGGLRRRRGRADAQHGGVRARRGAHRAPPRRARRHAAVRAARGVADGAFQPHLAHDALPRTRRRHPCHPGRPLLELCLSMVVGFLVSGTAIPCRGTHEQSYELSLLILGAGYVELAAGRSVAVVRKRARAAWWEIHELDPWQWSPRRLHHRFLLCADCLLPVSHPFPRRLCNVSA